MEEDELFIRPSTPDDAEAISSLICENHSLSGLHPDVLAAYHDLNSVERLRSRFESPDAIGRVIEVNGAIVGAALCLKETPTLAKFNRLHVAPSAQGRGAGFLLVQAAIEALRCKGIQRVFATPTPASVPSLLAILRDCGISASIVNHRDRYSSVLNKTALMNFSLEK